MNKHNQDGAVDALLLPLIIATVLLIGAAAFGFWAFGERQNYKNNTDQIVAEAVTIGKKEESVKNAKEYAEAAKNPLKTYIGPSQYGSLAVKYPKTWSAYVSIGDNSDGVLDGYFHPDTVPSVENESNSFALRIKVLSQSYSETVKSFDGQEGITVTPYSLPKVPRTIGVRIQGQIEEQKQGDMVLLPLRDKTLQIFSESKDFEPDFVNNILPNLSFAP